MIETLDVYEGPASIRQAGSVVDVACRYSVEEERVSIEPSIGEDEGVTVGGLKSWRGTAAGDFHGFDLWSAAVLHLPDGRRGDIVIYGVGLAETTSYGDEWRRCVATGTAEFVGMGEPPA